ncbi:MAG: polyprenyl synthetase family protein [bacterium]
MRLSEITAPIKDDLNAFEKQFANLLKSDVFLIDKVISYFVARRGKRLRPILSLLVSRLNGNAPTSKRYNAAAIVELMHTASLLHDDVVDDSYKRRGFPSINAIWKNKVSVLTGDYLFSKVLVAMFDIRDFHAYDIVSSTAQRMSQGELLQLERSHDYWMEEEIYYRLIGDKTASLISAACQLGAVAAEASDEAINRMGIFGENIGLAFQIRDDLLDLLGVEKTTGKPIGNDLRENKITLPLLYALKQAEKREAKRIIRFMKNGIHKKGIKTVVDFIKENGGVAYASEKAEKLMQSAVGELANYENSAYKNVLIKLVEFITTREH